jgi:hypothetical protein
LLVVSRAKARQALQFFRLSFAKTAVLAEVVQAVLGLRKLKFPNNPTEIKKPVPKHKRVLNGLKS